MMKTLKRVVVVLVAMVVALVAMVVAFALIQNYFGAVRHQHRVEAFEDDLYENVLNDFGGGAPVTVSHGIWAGGDIGDDYERCLGISRQSYYSLADPIDLEELAIQAERLSVYLEAEGWSVKRLSHVDAEEEVLPAAMRVHRIRAARDTEFISIDFLQGEATMRGNTNNCGRIKELSPNTDENYVVVESFGN